MTEKESDCKALDQTAEKHKRILYTPSTFKAFDDPF